MKHSRDSFPWWEFLVFDEQMIWVWPLSELQATRARVSVSDVSTQGNNGMGFKRTLESQHQRL